MRCNVVVPDVISFTATWLSERFLFSGHITTSHDLTPNGGLVTGNPLISGKSRLVKYDHLTRNMGKKNKGHIVFGEDGFDKLNTTGECSRSFRSFIFGLQIIIVYQFLLYPGGHFQGIWMFPQIMVPQNGL